MAVYISYFATNGDKDFQSVCSVVKNPQELEETWKSDVVSFLEYGPDDTSHLYVYLIPNKLYNDFYKKYIDELLEGNLIDIDLGEMLSSDKKHIIPIEHWCGGNDELFFEFLEGLCR